MKSVTVFALRSERKRLMEYLQRQGIVDITRQENAEPEQGFERNDTALSASNFERTAATAEKAVEILNEYVPENKGLLGSLSGRRIVSDEQYCNAVENNAEIMQKCRAVIKAAAGITECVAERARLNARIETVLPWETLDVSQQFTGTKRTAAFIGSLPKNLSEQEICEGLAATNPDIIFSVEKISSNDEQTNVFIVCPKADGEKMAQVLREHGFMRPPQATTKKPKEKIAELRTRLEQNDKRQEELKEQILELAKSRYDMELVADYFSTRAEKYRAIGSLDQSKNTFILKGYIDADKADELKSYVEGNFKAAVEIEEPTEEEVPVAIKNNAFTAPAAGLTELYALPKKNEVDPTPIMSFFYYFFFGMMLSDAGYGILLALGSWFLIKKCKPERNMERSLRLFMYCGISTIVWGIIFGSFFGDAIWVISETFFGKTLPPWPISPMNQAIELFIVSVAMGFVVIITGLLAKFINTCRNDGAVAAVFETGSWITILLGIGVVAVGIFLKVNILSVVGGVMAGLGALTVIANGVRVKGPAGIISGLGGLYDITGYISDLMSFSRLMALGLTTAAMGQVFNLLGAMGGRSVGGALGMFIIFTIGHLLSFALNALGAYVHTLRLQYVELFGKFYEGGGKPFKPFAHKSKYTRFKEDK